MRKCTAGTETAAACRNTCAHSSEYIAVSVSHAGKQTLGQEYCGVDLTAPGAGKRETTGLSKTPLRAYTFLRVAVPYLQVDKQ